MDKSVSETDREHHEHIAPTYDDWFVNPYHYRLLQEELANDVAKAFAPHEGLLVEFGSGTGAVTIPLHRRGYQVLAIDASEAMLGRLLVKAPDIRVLQGDIAKPLPLDAESAGCVLICQTLHHVADQAAVLREAHRLLRIGGTICISEPQRLPAGLDWLRRLVRYCCSHGAHVATEEPIDPKALTRLLTECGFAILRASTTFFFPYAPRSSWGRRLLARIWSIPGRVPLIRRFGGVFKVLAVKQSRDAVQEQRK